MFNSSLEAYGSVRSLAAVQNTAGAKGAVVAKPAAKVENTQLENKPVEVDKASLVTAVKKLNEFVAPALQTITFAIDDQSERMVVKVIDTASQKVLRQIPNDEVLSMSKTLDKLQGLVIRQTA
ncbi:MAG: flagellar protein FlaG [Methylotenera sp.]|nr:flagellar protein FlaG [Methylotenera sp.]